MSDALLSVRGPENASSNLKNGYKTFGRKTASGSLKTGSLLRKSAEGRHRSFGDISNKVGTVSSSTHNPALKVPAHSQATKKIESGHMKVFMEDEEPGYMPDIEETEDYSDIFPASILMSRLECIQFARFWETSRKPPYSCENPPPSPDSSLLDFTLDTVLEVPKIMPTRFESLIHDEDIIVPPPQWDD